MPTEEQEKKVRENSKSYLKYSSMAFQLLGIVAISFFAGKYLDGKLGFEQPILAVLFILISFTTYMYKLYKELFNEK